MGHVFRRPTSMENCIMLAKVDDTRRRGRPRIRWTDSFKEAAGRKIIQIKEKTKDREL